MLSTELSPPVFQGERSDTDDVFERFRAAETKIAIQKDGELTDLSREIISNHFSVKIPKRDPSDKRFVSVSEDGAMGYAYVRNKDIGSLVARRMVDFAVIGADRLAEDDIDEMVDVVTSYEDRYSWPLVLAVPESSQIEAPDQIRRVATQYPRIAERFFKGQGLPDVEIIPTSGSTEMYPYLSREDAPIDAVIDIRVTGSSLEANNLVEWVPIVGTAFPVLIKSKGFEVKGAESV